MFAANAGLLVAMAPQSRVGEARQSSQSRRGRWLGALGLVVVLASVSLSLVSAAAASSALAGRDDLRRGNAPAAISEYAKAARLAPWDDRYAIGAADAAVQAARLGEAESFYRLAIAANPSDPVTRHELARLYLANQDRFGSAGNRAAVRELTLALEQNPYYAEIRNDLGVALVRAGDTAGAARAFEAASGGRRDFVDPLLNLAALAIQRDDRDEAARRIDEALARNPNSQRASAMKAEFLVNAR